MKDGSSPRFSRPGGREIFVKVAQNPQEQAESHHRLPAHIRGNDKTHNRFNWNVLAAAFLVLAVGGSFWIGVALLLGRM